MKRVKKVFIKHEHWFAEWWSGILLIIIGIYGYYFPSHVGMSVNVLEAFTKIIPEYVLKIAFFSCGIIQLISLLYESPIWRAISAFFASFLLIWGTLNVIVYDGSQWHFSIVAWGIFSAINLFALARILSGVEIESGKL